MTFIANDDLLIKQTTVVKGLFNKALTFEKNYSRTRFFFFPFLAKNLSQVKHLSCKSSSFQELSLFEISIRLISTSIGKVPRTKAWL